MVLSSLNQAAALSCYGNYLCRIRKAYIRADALAYFLQQLINGLTLGAVYGLVAIGYTMVYGIIGMINFAHGEIYMIGAFITVIGFAVLGLLGIGTAIPALIIVLIVSIAVTSLYGWTVERVAYRPL